jgi:hypothetical protein
MTENKVPEYLDQAIAAGAARALRNRAARQRERTTAWTAITTDSRGQPVLIASGEAAIAARLADEFEALADDIEGEGGKMLVRAGNGRS